MLNTDASAPRRLHETPPEAEATTEVAAEAEVTTVAVAPTAIGTAAVATAIEIARGIGIGTTTTTGDEAGAGAGSDPGAETALSAGTPLTTGSAGVTGSAASAAHQLPGRRAAPPAVVAALPMMTGPRYYELRRPGATTGPLLCLRQGPGSLLQACVIRTSSQPTN